MRHNMNIRPLKESDLPVIEELHKKFYEGEFDLVEIYNNSIGLFVVTDDNDKIICVGGVRPIAEAVLITDKDRSVRERRSALYRVLDASEYITKNSGFDQLHVFVQDEEWMKHLSKIHFKPTAGRSLVRLL